MTEQERKDVADITVLKQIKRMITLELEDNAEVLFPIYDILENKIDKLEAKLKDATDE